MTAKFSKIIKSLIISFKQRSYNDSNNEYTIGWAKREISTNTSDIVQFIVDGHSGGTRLEFPITFRNNGSAITHHEWEESRNSETGEILSYFESYETSFSIIINGVYIVANQVLPEYAKYDISKVLNGAIFVTDNLKCTLVW